jgi:hypothetical protein
MIRRCTQTSLLVALRSRWASGARDAFGSLRIALWSAENARPRIMPASAMPEPVGLDTAALSELTDRVAAAAGDLTAAEIPAVVSWPGSALAELDRPWRAGADVRRLGATVQDWVATTRRSVDELVAADGAGADRLGPR